MKNQNRKQKKKPLKLIILGLVTILVVAIVLFFYFENPEESDAIILDDNLNNKEIVGVNDPNAIIDSVHVRTGLIEAEGLMTVVNNCTTCHSAKLVTQNRMGKAQWNATIRWMQEEQGLWELGDNQEVIVNYLVTNYPVLEKGRRQALTNIDWYNLEE